MKKLRYCLFFIFTLYLSSVFANLNERQYAFRSLDISDGLSQNTIHAIIQDRQGFMWFGTKDGLNRYDGISFQIFKKEFGNLGNNFITTLHEDAKGLIWIGTDAGLYFYSPLKESVERFTLKSNQGTMIERSVTSILSDEKGRIWISVDEQGLFCYSPEQGKLDNYFVNNSVQSIPQNITRFFFDSDGVCWLGLYGDNLYSTKDFKTLVPFRTKDGLQPFKNDIICKLLPNSQNSVYVGSAKGGLKEINLISGTVHDLLTKDEQGENIYVREIVFASENELWIGSESGLFVYNLRTGRVVHQQNVDGDPYSLTDNALYSIWKDTEGGMWIGTYFGGVNYFPRQYTYFEKVYPHKGIADMGKRVREFCAGKEGELWIGTEDKGLFRYRPETGELTPFRNPLIYHNVHALCMDGPYLWVGTFSKGLNRIDLRTSAVKNYQKGDAPNTLNGNDLFTICRTKEGEVWMGTTSGLLKYNPITDDFTRQTEWNGVFVYDIKEDADGNLWLSTYVNGVYRRDARTGKSKHFVFNESDPGSLPSDKVLSTFVDSHKRLWFTTQGGGFCRFEPKSETFKRYDSSMGLPSNVIYQIVEDYKGMFWITTNKGLIRFNPDDETFKVYTVANGLLSNQFNYQSSYIDPQGRIYLGSINGFIVFDPTTFEDNSFIPPVVITDFSIFNKKVAVDAEHSPLKESITTSEYIELTSDQNSFSFRIAALSYQAPEMNKLMYKLEGFDSEWYVAGNTPITYSNLPYGSYTFMVKGSNCDGVWNEQARILKIRILPPFYLSVWAYVIYFVLAVCAVIGLITFFKRRSANKHRRQMEKFEQEKERELYAAKFNFFTDVAHEIRTPLTLIKSPLESVLCEQEIPEAIKGDLLIMNQNVDRLLNLTNQLLDFRKTESNGFKLNLVECSIVEVLQRVYIRFTSLAKQKGLELSVEQPVGNLPAAVDREALTKIFSNLLNNALKYAGTYVHVNLFVKEEANEFCLIVSNDGRIVPLEMREEIFKPFIQYKDGKETASMGTGIGLALSRSLAELHDGSLKMDSSLDCNRFILTVPIVHVDAAVVHTETLEPPVGQEPVIDVEQAEASENQQSRRYTVLVVEDNAEMLAFVSRQLSPSYTILTATNGAEALKVLEVEYVHLVVSDVMMPHMDGMELCQRIKSDLDYSHIPVILLTAKTNLESKIEGLQMGADSYIEKPFSVEYLKANIQSLLSNREKTRKAFNNSPFIVSNTVALTKADEEFLKALRGAVVSNMQEPDFSLDHVAGLMNMSRSSLYRKIKGLLDMTPNDYIRVERLKRAAELLAEKEYKVNEICYMVGFSTSSYFAKCFQKQFGVLPKDFALSSDGVIIDSENENSR